MATKLQYYQNISEQAAKEITAKRGNWTNFLDTAARMYKYPFPDQLLIHAQRPNAVACAQIETWNDTFNRWVHRGAKGIALIDDTGNYPRLRYVFDVADTAPSLFNARPVQLWEMQQEHKMAVLKHLETIYDDVGDSLADSFHNIANQLANEYYEDNAKELRYRAEDSFLEDYDDDNLALAFKQALTNSIAYSLMSRCGFDTTDYFEDEDFQYIFDFNTVDMVYALGTATSELSEQVLRGIEVVIKKYERQHANERGIEYGDQLHTSGRLFTSQHQTERTTAGNDGTVGKIRQNEESLSEGAQDNNLQHHVAERDVVSSLEGDGRSSEEQVGSGDEPVNFQEPDTRQTEQSDGMDSGNERLEVPSGGNGSERTNLHLTEYATYSQVGNRFTEKITASSISLDEADSILRDGGNDKNSILRITAFFSKGLSLEQNTEFIKGEYLSGRWSNKTTVGGKGYQFGAEQISIWFDEAGLKIGHGQSALNSKDFALVSWEDVAERIQQLYFTGQYVSHDILDEAIDNEKQELAESLWYFYRDDLTSIPGEWDSKAGFPGDVAIIKDLLGNEVSRNTILEKLENDVTAWQADPTSRSWHNPIKLLADVKNSILETKGFPLVEIQSVNFMRFITNDEVDNYLTKGSNISEGKCRIFSHFIQSHTPKERIDFLKNEYGHGGGSWVDGGWHEAEPGKGITLKRKGCEDINLNWNQVTRRIEQLVQCGLYMNRQELENLPNYEMLMLARNINNFYSNLPEEYNGPFTKDLDFYYPKEEEWAAIGTFLNNGPMLETVIGEMQYIYANTPEDDRYFNLRKTGYENLMAFRDGTYTLFPGLDSLPSPETAIQTPIEIVIEKPFAPSSRVNPDQLTLFNIDAFPVLPSSEEQKAKIEQIKENSIEKTVLQTSLPITQEEIDTLLLSISNEDKSRISAQFATNPRSKEAVQLVREIYDKIEETITRLDGKDGYLGILGDKDIGVSLVRGDDGTLPLTEREPAETLSLNWTEVIKQVIELAKNERFTVVEQSKEIEETPIEESIDNVPEQPEINFDEVSQTILERVMADDEFKIVLENASNRGALRNPLNIAIEKVINELEQDEPHIFNHFYNDDDFNDNLFDYIYRQAWESKNKVTNIEVDQPTSETMAEITDEAIAEDSPPETITSEVEELAKSPQPVFFVSWEDSKYDFNLNLYEDGAVVGYNKDGVEYKVSRSGTINFVVSKGFIWGDNVVPGDIYNQIREFENGTLTEEQVRDNYLKVLEEFKQVKENTVISPDNKIVIEPTLPVVDKIETEPHSTKLENIPKGNNFRITDDHLGEGGAKTKYKYNIEAIKTLISIESENRNATPEEQQTLSRYVGWGGLPMAFDSENTQWINEYKELKEVLSLSEYDSAKASTLNAHYTSPTVIRAIYDTIERMGFRTGNILEPACGVGNFLGLLPESMQQSKIYGVELDSITARIAKQLYPKANIKETGFEKIDTPDSFFDVAIGNVPFGGYGVADKRYDKYKFQIHDYFFGKSLDQVRPGGVIAFITSKGTLDKQNSEVRKYIAQRAELLGAVRLPNNAFLKNAGTEVTSDIIFLQKRDRPIDIEPDWVHLGTTENGISINRYFIDNPEMVLGTMSNDSGFRMYGNENSTTCIPTPGADLTEQLKTALFNVQGQYEAPELDDMEGVDNHAIPADPDVKNFSYTSVDGNVYFRENSMMFPVELPVTTLERIKGMIGLRNCVHQLISLQLEDHSEEEIKAKQDELNILYDDFNKNFGLINSQGNNRAFSADNSYYLLCSLEILDENGELERKADMFTKRTIKQKTVITHVDTASEALAVSLGEKACVDIEYMAELTGFDTEKLINDLQNVIFYDFGNPNNKLPSFDSETMKLHEKFPLVTADEYLSGNVREKLQKAYQFNEIVGDIFHGVDTTINIKALETAQPKDLDASEIAVCLGSTWIDAKYVQQFMHELLNTSWRNQNIYQVKFHAFTGEWQVTSKSKAQYSDVQATVTYGTSRMNAYQIIDDTLNLRDVRVYDYKRDADGKEKRELNKKETTLAQQKQELIKQSFKDWIWKNPERRQALVKEYNEKFNSVRPREYDGTHITFSGISPEITMRPHQLNAIAHIIYGGNTLLAHVVGAGKTFEMVAAAMESKRLGLCQKSLFAVPNHLTEQWAGEFLRLYPSANILVASKKDFEMRNRKKFCAKIATGDFDAVIIGHSQLEKIPISRERQERHLNEQLWEIEEGIRELKSSNGERFSIKQLEKTKKSIEIRLTKLLDSKKRDDVVNFEELGIDRLYTDEAHAFKNLFLYTKMRNIAGLSTSEAQKSSDLFMKCRYLDELTGNKGSIFATGTPISNSMTEMYTLQRYLQYDTLVAKGLSHFDSWASIFGETQTSIELAPEGTGYRARTRFAKFHNLPEVLCCKGSLKTPNKKAWQLPVCSNSCKVASD